MLDADLVCLANSRKLGGRCVAGVALSSGEWIRPVSNREQGTLYRADYEFSSGEGPELLDVVVVPLALAAPEPHQPENHRLAAGTWRRIGALRGLKAIEFLTPLLEVGPDLIRNDTDRIPLSSIQNEPLDASLALIEPENPRVFITTNAQGARQVRMLFDFAGGSYNLAVTDPHWAARCSDLGSGFHEVDQVGVSAYRRLFVTISLSEPLGGNCFKLIAAVIIVPGVRDHY